MQLNRNNQYLNNKEFMTMKIFAAVALLGFAVVANADGSKYIGLSLGGCHYDVDFPGTIHGFDNEHSQCAGLIAGKHYAWGAIEGEYSQLGSYSIRNTTAETDTTIDAASISAVFKGGYFFAKVGAERWAMSMTFNGTPASTSGFGVLYGLGAEFPFSTDARIRVGFDQHAGVDDQRVNVKPGVSRFYTAITLDLK